MGFKERWIGLMMTCIKSITYSILVNGEPRGMMHPTLPSFSFYYAQKDCTASSSRLPDSVVLKDSLSVKEALNSPYLFLADDNLLFCKATPYECNSILKNFIAYESVFKQQINKEKTKIFFSKSAIDEAKQKIKTILGVHKIQQYEKYLRLPSFIGRGKNASFNYIKDRVWQK